MKTSTNSLTPGTKLPDPGRPETTAPRSLHLVGNGTDRRPLATSSLKMVVAVLSICVMGLHGFAQSYSIDWHSIDGGGGTSTGGVYSISGTIGQPDASTTPMTGGQYSLTGGFWSLIAVQRPGAPVLSIAAAGPGMATVSWSPDTGTNWVLQQTAELTLANWTNSPSGSTNPIVVPASGPTRFYRLHKP